MIYNIYSIRDIKSNAFMNIFTEANDETAKRIFETIKKDEKTIFGMYPTDFELWKIGEMNNNTGITATEKVYIIGGVINE